MALQITALILLIAVTAFVGRSLYVSQPLFKEHLSEAPEAAFTLAPVEKALSFARTPDGRSLLVTEMSRNGVTAVDLAAATGSQKSEPLDYFRALGEEGLMPLIGGESKNYGWQDLGVPFDTQTTIIAAGTNFKAHAEEVGLEDGPFLFPKLSEPTAWQVPVVQRTRLDYEVELCAVAIDDIASGQKGRFAYVLCNDLTDRWALLRNISLKTPLGRTGFPEGKGGEGMLPVGAILTVPKQAEFYNEIELGLSVNGRLRQRAGAALMIWDADAIAQKALSICGEDFYLHKEILKIAECDGLKRGTAVLLGTPEGVAFQLPNIWMPWAYLRKGDMILTYGTHLGILETRIGK
ncbi:MAG: fumarylacetoacetate hydrolase family protein [Parvularculales bacterium]